ncbi:hypothetical protein [Endozoicomonas atrinae]|uniref:hypothetical protein n=1 Tax=Endozoicomonas atrinae TaxID=1333660 RepID=UPI003B00CFBE
MDAEQEIKKLKLRLDTLEQQFYDLTFSPSETDAITTKILEQCGTQLVSKIWAERNNPENIDAAYWISHAFYHAWKNKDDQSELQYLIGIVGKRLRIDSMPSYTAILDWIKAFNNFNKGEVKLIGKSAAIKLAKAGASKELKKYVLMAAQNNDAFSIPKIVELINREKEKGGSNANP